jgi:hypothetical protein
MSNIVDFDAAYRRRENEKIRTWIKRDNPDHLVASFAALVAAYRPIRRD